MYWMNSAGFLPDVCWEKMGEARNLRNPQWNTSSSLDLIGSVLLGCLCTKTCMTDIYAQKKKTWGQQKLFCVAGAAFLTKRKHFQMWIPSVHGARETREPEVCLTGHSPSQKKAHQWCAGSHTSHPEAWRTAEWVKPKIMVKHESIYSWRQLLLSTLPWLHPPQLQPQPICGGECVQSSGTGIYANSRGASFPWGPKVTSGNFLTPCNAGTCENRTATQTNRKQ